MAGRCKGQGFGGGIEINHTRPEHGRGEGFAFEWVKMLTKRSGFSGSIATLGGEFTHQVIFRHQQIEHLRRSHLQRAVDQEEINRVRRFILCNLQNAFVDGIDNRFAFGVALIADSHGFAGLGGFRHGKLNRCGARFDIGFERHNSIAERAQIDFARIDIPDKSDVDIALAREFFRHGNFLNCVGLVRAEPLSRDHMIALQRDESGPGIGCGDIQLDLFTRTVGFFVDLDIQYSFAVTGWLFTFTCNLGRNLGHDQSVGGFQAVGEITDG